MNNLYTDNNFTGLFITALDSLRAETGKRGIAPITGKAVEEKGLGKWESLCKASVGVYGVAGFEATATFKFSYVDGA